MNAKEMARTLAENAIVLLKNTGSLLPLAPGKTVAFFGRAALETVLSGNGSGAANTEDPSNVLEECRKAGLVPVAAVEDFYRGEAAFTRNRFGVGTAYYLAARTDTDLLRRLYGTLLESLGIRAALPGAVLPRGVTAHARESGTARFIFVGNYTDAPHTVDLAGEYEEVFSGERVKLLNLAPYGCAVLSDFTKI